MSIPSSNVTSSVWSVIVGWGGVGWGGGGWEGGKNVCTSFSSQMITDLKK
jgi:hypothetical protein